MYKVEHVRGPKYITKKTRMALASRRPLTSRQAVRQVLKATSGATHFVVKFTEDQAVSVVAAKHVVEPLPSTLKVFGECLVKWSDNKTYKATILAMGK